MLTVLIWSPLYPIAPKEGSGLVYCCDCHSTLTLPYVETSPADRNLLTVRPVSVEELGPEASLLTEASK